MAFLYGNTFSYLYQNNPHGYSSVFIKEGGKGLKLFRSEDTRDHCYDMQKILHGLGLAPAVGAKFVRDFPDVTAHGYETEIAETIPEACSDEVWNEWNRMAKDLARECLDHGWSWSDPKTKNIGLINGRPVVIDCGSFDPFPPGEEDELSYTLTEAGCAYFLPG